MKRLILAGGGGTRLWPLSRKLWPKQFLPLVDSHETAPNGNSQSLSLLNQTILRASGSFEEALQNVFVITGQGLYSQILQDLRSAGMEAMQPNVLVEPSRRNTAPAIALAAQHLLETSPEGEETILAILPADHSIHDSLKFRQHLQEAETLAKDGYIVTLGVTPTEPHTGYGYIQVNANHYKEAPANQNWFPVERFVEKPDYNTAKYYYEADNYFWNAGIFVLKIKTLMESLKAHAPSIHQHLHYGYTRAFQSFEQMPDISFDYAVMEHAKKVAVIPVETQWSDVGSWDSLYDILPKSESRNAVRATHDELLELINTERCMLWSDTKRPVALLGMQDCLVIDTPDALLIAKRGESQQVRTVVDALERAKHSSMIQPAQQLNSWGQLVILNQQEVKTKQAKPVVKLEVKPNTQVELTVSEVATLHVVSGFVEAQGDAPYAFDSQTFTGQESLVLKAGRDGASLMLIGTVPSAKLMSLSPTADTILR